MARQSTSPATFHPHQKPHSSTQHKKSLNAAMPSPAFRAVRSTLDHLWELVNQPLRSDDVITRAWAMIGHANHHLSRAHAFQKKERGWGEVQGTGIGLNTIISSTPLGYSSPSSAWRKWLVCGGHVPKGVFLRRAATSTASPRRPQLTPTKFLLACWACERMGAWSSMSGYAYRRLYEAQWQNNREHGYLSPEVVCAHFPGFVSSSLSTK